MFKVSWPYALIMGRHAVDSTFAGQVGPQGASNPSHNCGTEYHDKHKVSLSREVGGNWELGLCKMRNTTLLPFR